MKEKTLLNNFLAKVEQEKKLTEFIVNLFDYENFHDYNYLFRRIDNRDNVIIDIYDNISDNRFNRYIFSFDKADYDYEVTEEKNVFVHYITVLNLKDSDNKLLKFAYLFKLDKKSRIEYAKKFLNDYFVDLLKKIDK